MKYETPKIEIVELESADVITVSGQKYEIETDGDDKGNIIFDALNLFS